MRELERGVLRRQAVQKVSYKWAWWWAVAFAPVANYQQYVVGFFFKDTGAHLYPVFAHHERYDVTVEVVRVHIL